MTASAKTVPTSAQFSPGGYGNPMRTVRTKVAARKLQKAHRDSAQFQRELAFLCQDWQDAYNVGGMFRVADALGAAKLVFTGQSPVPPNPQVAVTSLGAHRRVPWELIESHEEAALTLLAEGFSLIAVELADSAEPFDRFCFPEKTCLVLGHEGAGVYQKVLRHCAGAVFIPMAGKGRSLNVHVAAAIVGFQVALSPLDPPQINGPG